MQLTINGQPFTVPFTLSDITLGKFVEYYERYGKDIDKLLDEALKVDYHKELTAKGYDVTEEDIELHKGISLDNHMDSEALSWFSFWTGIDLIEVRNEPFITPLLSHYRILRNIMQEEIAKSQTFPTEIDWNDEIWEIQNFTVTPASNMTAGEIFTAKEVMLQTYNLGLSRWQALIYLCAVFFRKKGEAFSNDLIVPGSERLEMLKELPMEHALKVSFFLKCCVSIWRNTSLFSTIKEAPTLQQN